jgi:spiro-SPASM protein
MNLQTRPALLGIYLQPKQIELIQNESVSDFLLQKFASKIKDIFGEIKVFSNFPIQVIPNLSYMGELDEKDFLFLLAEKLPPSEIEDEDIDEVYFAYLTGISPLLSKELTIELENRHTRFLSQYSYSENLPSGIIPYFISREFVNSIPQDTKMGIHDFLLKNINNYDTEIFYKSPDLRQFRLDFSLSDKRSIHLVNSIIQIAGDVEYQEIQSLLLNNPKAIRPAPSYLEVEIYRGCEYNCIFCPREFSVDKSQNLQMEVSTYTHLLRDFEVQFPFSLTICLGGLGEPLLHPHLNEILDISLRFPYLEKIYIETALYPNIESLLDYISKLDSALVAKLNFIINLSTLNDNTYKSIYQTNNSIQSILDKIEILTKKISTKNIHIQMIKMQEIESEIDLFFQKWEEKGFGIILQKYNSYAGKLKERRVSDLTPIQRDFCWHLARDFYVQWNGDISICKQEPSESIGNILSEDIASIWNRGSAHFQNSMQGNHASIPAPCLQCDEWYTFNA